MGVLEGQLRNAGFLHTPGQLSGTQEEQPLSTDGVRTGRQGQGRQTGSAPAEGSRKLAPCWQESRQLLSFPQSRLVSDRTCVGTGAEEEAVTKGRNRKGGTETRAE